MRHPLAVSKAARIAASQEPLLPLVPDSATGAVRAARLRQIPAISAGPKCAAEVLPSILYVKLGGKAHATQHIWRI